MDAVTTSSGYSQVIEITSKLSSRMNSLILLCFVAIMATVIADHYTDRYDTVDLDEILRNRRLLIPYIKCILDQGKCAPDAKELKEHIREALETDCVKCTSKQRSGTRQVIGHLINEEPSYWKELTEKFDPENKYTVQYENELRTIHHS